MNFFVKGLMLVVFIFVSTVVNSQSSHRLTLPEATKKALEVNEDEDAKKGKVLSAKTWTIADKKIHIIKILTTEGQVRKVKIEMETGKIVEEESKK